MTRNRKIIAIVAGVALVLGAVVVFARRDNGGGDEATLIVPRLVDKRTLDDVLTVNGELVREELRKINSPVDGRVSEVLVEDGDEVNEGDTVFALDGRAAVAVPGDFSFFRSLDVGSDGPDVLQLESILDASGYDPGAVDRLFTEQTRSALTDWQLDHGYGGATPEPEEVLTVALQQNSAGYDIGKANSVGITIGPTVPTATGSNLDAELVAFHAAGTPEKPLIDVQSIAPATVQEGGTLTITFSSSPAPASSTTVEIESSGDATGADDADDGDYQELPGSFVFPAGQTTFTMTRKVFVDDVVEDAEDVTVELSDQFGNDPNYQVGPLSSQTATIAANGVDKIPVLTIASDTDVIAEDGSATLTIESNVELGRDLDIGLSVVGSAVSGKDFEELDDEVTLTAGNTETTVTLSGREDDLVEGDELVAVKIAPRSTYRVGEPSGVWVAIESDNIPEMSLIGGGRVNEGGSIAFTIVSSQPVVEPTSVNYQVQGSADAGEDYKALSGTAIMPAGASRVDVTVTTIDDDVLFQPSDMLVADWPARIGQVEVDEGEFVLQGAVMLTLTEPRFTVKLTVSASDRARLEVGQDVVVDLEAGGQDALDGVITELDENATVSEEGDETYEGVVEVTEEPKGVDGAAVSIDVTLSERPDVLAVPVAAVVSVGGKNEVRVVDDDGKMERRVVEIGLVDDDFVEIVSGLDGDELVVVSVEADGESDGGGGGDEG
jgi:multidrug efflux pump subunit AcrA (membrane-fusion protein)